MGIRDQMVVPFTSVKGAWTPKLLRPDLWINARRPDVLFQAIAGTTPVTDGSVCGYVGDISGNGFDLTASFDSSVRPNWVFNNGLSYLDCDSAGSSNTILRRNSILGLYAAGACSVFAAIRANPGSVTDVLWCESNSGTTTPTFSFRADATTSSSSAIFVRTDASTTLANAALNTSIFDNTDRVAGFIWNGTTAFGYNNLTESAGVSLASGSTITFDRFAIGSTGTSSQFEARVYEMLVFKRALNITDRIRVTKYLAKKAMGINL